MAKTALEQIEDLKKQIETLKAGAITELANKIAVKKQELQPLLDEYEKLTGKTVKGKRVRTSAAATTIPTLEELKKLIKESKNGVLNVRQAKLDTAAIKRWQQKQIMALFMRVEHGLK